MQLELSLVFMLFSCKRLGQEHDQKTQTFSLQEYRNNKIGLITPILYQERTELTVTECALLQM